MPREPEPANSSKTVMQLKSILNRCNKTLKSACLDISEVGRVDEIEGAAIKRPPNVPFIIRHRLISYAKIAKQRGKTIVPSPKLRDVLATSDLLVFALDGVIGVTSNDAEIARFSRKSSNDVIIVANKNKKKFSTLV